MLQIRTKKNIEQLVLAKSAMRNATSAEQRHGKFFGYGSLFDRARRPDRKEIHNRKE